MSDKPEPIDAVICWVDGSDEHHHQKRMGALEAETGKPGRDLATATDPTRFIDNGELYYCIHSLRTFAPWLRTIFLVTDNQAPDFLTPELRERYNVRVVDHREIFAGYEWALPVFSSRTIETALWRIPELAPRFIYLNDDFLLTRTLPPEEFFREDKVVLRGRWNKAPGYGRIRMAANRAGTFLSKHLLGITRSMHLLLQIRSAELAGIPGRFFRVPHVPHPIRTETLRSWFAEHPDRFEQNIAYKFRHADQFSALHLAHYLEIIAEHAILKPPKDYTMINGEMDFGFTVNRKLRQIEKGNISLACLNGMERFRKVYRDRIRKSLEEHMDIPPLF